MKAGKLYRSLGMLAIVLMLGTISVLAAPTGGSKFNHTTQSKEAKQYFDQAIQALESYALPPQINGLAKKAIDLDPDYALATYIYGVTLTPPQDPTPVVQKAFELGKKASDGERRYLEAVQLIRQQKATEALPILKELSTQFPDERLVQMMLGQVSMNSGNRVDAKAAFEKARQLDGTTARVYGFLGNVALMDARFSEARELFKTALNKKVPGAAPFNAHYGLAYAEMYDGKPEKAIKHLEAFYAEYIKTEAPKFFPPVFIWNSIARINLETGKAQEAMKAYEKGYESVPSSNLNDDDKKTWLGRMHHGRARSLAKLGKFDEAWQEAELIKKMIEDGGEKGKQYWTSYHYVAGYIKLEKGELPAAIEHLKQADQTNEFHRLLLARAYEKSGDKDNAKLIYTELAKQPLPNLETALAYPEAKKKLKG
ncbi:MAG TPA: tetratricopeptide repeat protein [Acidobacteriota bacterium]|nr:tetratricopeptide repeat protein [Acidobacteriota bacterium]HNG93120.1 tetratricopeptide repeat protein [Acidobacteriota bacterium]